jgi:AraC-like DNA-binding protein
MDLTCDERPSDSPFIERVWYSQSDRGGSFVSIAQPHWEMVVTKYRGRAVLTVRGPETRATPACAPADADFMGIQFKVGTLMPDFPARMLMDRQDVNLPEANSRAFWLNGAAWQFPDYENAETFVDWLVRDGLLIRDPVVRAVLNGQLGGISLRTAQRRFLQATGLTHGLADQIERARCATILLKQGVSILDTVYRAGYADQPHLTRSLKRFIGHTPAQIIAESRSKPLSFLFKTEPF